MKHLYRIFFLLFFLTFLSLHSFCPAQDLGGIILDKSNMWGYDLIDTYTLYSTWPLVNRLPGYMQIPPVASDSSNDKLELSSDRLNGTRQVWQNQLDRTKLTVDYGVYESAIRARDAICYIAYNRSTMINIGDLGFWVNYFALDTVAGGGIYFIKGPYIFMVDSPSMTVEKDIAKKILQNF